LSIIDSGPPFCQASVAERSVTLPPEKREPMPITPFLAGQAFAPETLRSMSAAFEAAYAKLRLVIRHDPAPELIAKFIVETCTNRGA
jgi:hypothetical protein